MITGGHKEGVVFDVNVNFIYVISTHFAFCQEMIEGKGEDSGFESYNELAGIAGVFDGCGGLGARKYPDADDKTGAYLASRTVGGAVKKWFDDCCDAGMRFDYNALKEEIDTRLHMGELYCGDTGLKMKGTMVRNLPTTMAAVIAYIRNNGIVSEHVWAGDSRTYMLTRDGLIQISVDDIEGEDALSNISNDGVLTNVISSDGHYELHRCTVNITEPCLLFSATDGCFGYLSSPMMFEAFILDSLMNAENVEGWKNSLHDNLGSYSGDDYSMGLMAFGFESFNDMKSLFVERHSYITELARTFESMSDAEKERTWNGYASTYYRYYS